jgi:glycosyltransferase involved in cell wall biosynthesis
MMFSTGRHCPGPHDAPRISIIVPLYKVEKYLDQCLESLTNQTLSEIEIILIDDGSPDGSGSMADRWSKNDRRIKVIHQENRGSGLARNAGLKIATGEYIGFVDPDDWVSEDYFKVLYEVAEKRQADVAATHGVILWNEADGTQHKKHTGFSGEKCIATPADRARILLRTAITWNKIYRRDFLEKHAIRFSEIHCTGQDNIVTFMAMTLANFIATTGQGTYFYRTNIRSSTKSPRTRQHLLLVEIYHEIHTALISRNLEADYLEILRQRMRDDLARHYLRMSDELRNVFLARIGERFDRDIVRHVEATGHELIVSLTSYPPRIGMVHQAIKTLLGQTKKADKVILWLADSEFPNREKDLPKELLDLAPKGLSIEWCEDLKSYKKIMPALRKYPKALICIADDDNLYSSDWLQKLYDSYLRAPEFIHGSRMRRIKLSDDGEVRAYGRWRLSTSAAPSFLNILTGLGGVLYPPGSFHEDVLREDVFMRLAPRADDLWLWAMTVLNHRKIKATDDYVFAANPIAGSEKCSLWEINGKGGKNDEQLANILEHYPQLLAMLQGEVEGVNIPQNEMASWDTTGQSELVSALAENLRLGALVEAQKRIHRLEAKNAPVARLGNLLLKSVDTASFLSLPGQLGKFWYESRRKRPPESLGKTFEKLIAAYDKGGFEAAETLLSRVSPVMQARAYTALARHLQHHDELQAAEAARKAYEIDPEPYRLKWLIFRLHEAGDLAEAEALLDILPRETPFSASETRQARQLRSEARMARQRKARLTKAWHDRSSRTEASSGLHDDLRTLHGKLDLAINTLNNAATQITSTLYSRPAALSDGVPDLVVSLTTIPSRLNIVHHTIESIFSQSLLPGRLVLWISDETHAIPSQLLAQERRGLEIRKIRDVGPLTKLIYALREFPGQTIVTVDDDIVYPGNIATPFEII